MGLTSERDALVVVDCFSDYKDCFPLQSKSAEDTLGAFHEYFGKHRPSYIHTDSAPELIKAVKQLPAPHGKGTPYRHQATPTANAPFVRLSREPEPYLSTPDYQVVSGRLL